MYIVITYSYLISMIYSNYNVIAITIIDIVIFILTYNFNTMYDDTYAML